MTSITVPHSRLASTARWTATLRALERDRSDRLFADPWAAILAGDEGAFLEERGWKVVLSQPGQPEANHGHWTLPVIPVMQPNMPHNWYVTAHKEKI